LYLTDANIFLELLLDQEKADECEGFLEDVRRGRRETYLADLTLDSVLIVMDNKGLKSSVLRDFLLSLSAYKGLRYYALSILDRLHASRVVGETDLDYEDSVLVHLARKLQVEGIISFDKDLDGVKGIRRFEPSNLSN